MATVMSSPTTGSAQCQPERDAAGAEQDGEAGEAVGAGVQPVGDQGGRADPPPDADPVAGDDLVAGEPDRPPRRRPPTGG